MPTFGSLFAGIGGIDLGLEWAGWVCKWQVENDPFCVRVLEEHWPDVRRHPDVRTFLAEGSRGWDVDLVAGGFPCQDISTAHTNGRRRGLEGDRSGLWSEFRRVVAGIRPRFVLVENSPAWERWTEMACEDLFGLGYCPTPIEVEASSVGAPHARPRVFVVAHAHGEGESPCPVHAEMASLCEASGAGRDGWGAMPDPVEMDDGFPSGMVLRAYGNAVVPQVAERFGRMIRKLIS